MNARPLAAYVSPGLAPHLDPLGMDVAVLTPEPGIVDIAQLLDSRGIKPDVLIQDERLAPRTLLKGLDSLGCPTVFWSMDPHLNFYWHRAYAALFDALACTQKRWGEKLATATGRPVEWIAWSAAAAPWSPHEARPHPVSFVGRVTKFRPLRQRFAAFLSERFGCRVESDVPHPEVRRIYEATRLAPNESIRGEITQRLFAASGAGCLVLEPLRDNGLEDLFEPGVEVETYADALELEEAVTRFLAHPLDAGRVARAGWERCVRDHQPHSRLEALGRLARGATASAPRGQEADRLFWLAAGRCLESSLLPALPEEVIAGLAAHQDHPDCLTAILRLLTAGGQDRDALALGMHFSTQGYAPAHPEYNAALCALALRLNQFGLAATLHGAWRQAAGLPPARVECPADLYAQLAVDMAAQGEHWRPGFPYDPERHLPATASEFHHLCLQLDPDNLAVLKRAESILRELPGSEIERVGYLSRLTLHQRRDFRLGLALGLADLKAFRVEEGLQEIRLAFTLAQEQDRLDAFTRMLAAGDRRGLIRLLL